MLEAAKRRVIDTMLASEFTVLTDALARIAAGHFSTRDFTRGPAARGAGALRSRLPGLSHLRHAGGASEADRAIIDHGHREARERWSGPDPEIFDFLRDAVTLDLAKPATATAPPGCATSRSKLQQFTGPLMAKALEDTTFYRHHRLLALNEVGGEPDAPR